MTASPEPYPTARGVEAAIKTAAHKAAQADPALDTGKRIELEYFNRFLSRIFSQGDESEWVLKGGTGMLARVPSTRSTHDIDLYRQGFTLNQALADLRRLAAIDLGDHFRFEYAGHEPSLGDATQPYVDGYRVFFNVFIGTASKGTVHIDLVVGAGMTDEIQTMRPKTALDLPRLISNPYRLYPVVDQIADKVCATMTSYDGRPSSREKDLVDIVVFAVTQDIDGDALRLAIETERQRRNMKPFEQFTVPSTWGRGYARQSRPVPHCAGFPTVESAAVLVSRLIDPAIAGETQGKNWSAHNQQWQ